MPKVSQKGNSKAGKSKKQFVGFNEEVTDNKDRGEGRPVLHPKKEAIFRLAETGNPVYVTEAKEILGWDDSETDESYTLKDLDGKKIKLRNNLHNRPFSYSLAMTYAYAILRKIWKVNGQGWIVGRTGLTLSCQHRFVGLVLARQIWAEDPEQWPAWDEEPYLEGLLVYGIDEDDDTVNTIDIGKVRSLADIIYRSDLFNNLSEKDRKKIARIAQFAVKMLWHRTGASARAFSPSVKRTVTDSMLFIDRHPKLLEAISYIFTEDDSNKISRYLTAGYASAMLYLMGCSKTKDDDYFSMDNPDESALNWDNWDKACEFWVLLGSDSGMFSAVKEKLLDDDWLGTPQEKCAILTKAWLEFSNGREITKESLELVYITDTDTGIKSLDDVPVVGGIDRGNPSSTAEPSPEEIMQRQAEARHLRKIREEKPTGPIAKGETVWVKESNGGHWRGLLAETRNGKNGVTAVMKVSNGFAGAGREIEVSMDKLTRDQPMDE